MLFTNKRSKVTSDKITIPARASSPKAELFVKIISQDKEEDENRPIVFILPGGPGIDHTAYSKYSCLIDVADIVFHDPRGCGRSSKDHASTYSMENYIDDVEALRQALNFKKIIVLGKSYGSVCSMGYALRYGHTVEKLILSAGAPSFRSIETAKKNLMRQGTPEQVKVAEKLWNGQFKNNQELAEFFIVTASLYSNHAHTRLESFMLARAAKNFCFEATNLGFSDFLRRFDFEPDLHLIKNETLILAGEHDWVNDISHIKVMAEKIPNNTFRVFENSGHAMESDAGDIYFEEIRKFIRGE